MRTRLALAALALLGVCSIAPAAPAAPKKLLVVSVTTNFRHSSIATGERILRKLAAESGAFTLDFVEQPPGQPDEVKNPPGDMADPAVQRQHQADLAAYAAGMDAWYATVRKALQKLSPASLEHYDGVVFLNTTGPLQIPDRDGFLAWIKAGHAFIGTHSASDTFHDWPAYGDMLGGEFYNHSLQAPVDCLNKDPRHPANKGIGVSLRVGLEEIYLFKRYDPARVHELLVLDKDPITRAPGHFPISWCRAYGKGKVFYTALGHREDIWDTDPGLKDRQNTAAVSEAFQAHLLGGIKWALGLEPGDSEPQAP